MKNVESLAADLRRLAVQTGHLSPACLGCGHEQSCSTRGCALIKEAAETLEKLDRYHCSQLENLLEKLSRVEAMLEASEAARSALGHRLAAAEKALHESKSD